MRIDSLNIEQFNEKYRFFSSGAAKEKNISESIFYDKKNEYARLVFDDLNGKLEQLEGKGNYSSVLVKVEQQPKELVEMLSKVAGGKYLRFMQQNVDGIAFGKGLETLINGTFFDELAAVGTREFSSIVTSGKMDRIILVDTYNEMFQNVEIETKDDEAFTELAQLTSVFVNQLKQAYFVANKTIKEDEGLYGFLQEVLEDVKDHISQGNNFRFVGENKKDIFVVALDMMKSTIDDQLSELGAQGNGRFSFSFRYRSAAFIE